MTRKTSKKGQQHQRQEGDIPLKDMARVEESDIDHHRQDKDLGNIEDGEGKHRIGNDDDSKEGGRVAINNRRQHEQFCTKRLIQIIIIGIILSIAIITTVYLLIHFLSAKNETKQKILNGLKPPNPEVPLPPSGSVLHMFENAAVCSDSDVCSKIGRDIFHKGGSVVDSAIATLLCNGITTMQSMGLGGGFLMNVFIKSENKAYTLDAREAAPFAAYTDMFIGKPKGTSMQGPLAIAVPGEALGYWEAYKRFGTISWKDIVGPSVEICEKGFILSKHMSDSLRVNKNIRRDFHLRKMFVNETDDSYYRIGSLIHPPSELCDTYRTLSAKGGPDFYTGSMARLISEDLRDIGSIVELNDLQTYQPIWRDSIPIHVGDSIMYVVPPPGGGTLIAFIINILRGYNLTRDSISNPKESILTYHRMIEAFKFAYGKRSELGDLQFNNLTTLINNLTSPEYADAIRELIDDSKTFNDTKHYGAEFVSKADNGTSHLSIIGPNGDAISVTSTINFYFGCSHVGRRTGIIFNSGMDDFSSPGVDNFFGVPSSEPNYIMPQKRALSSMSPTIVADRIGNVKLVVGAAGGTKIITSVVMVIMRTLWFQQDIKQALDAPRIHHQLLPNEIQYEYGNLQELISALEAKGHLTVRYQERGSAMCAIAKNSTAIYANADYRKKGEVFGL